ncbi:MAG: DUF5693 family protein [Cellulosilyticaceae bacterium]
MKKQIKGILGIITIISLVICVGIGVFRINVEKQYKAVEIAVRYTDVLKIAQQTDRSVEAVLKDLKESGANTLFVRENTVVPNLRGEMSNYKEQGKATYYEGYDLRRFYPDENNIVPQFIYIEALDEQTLNTIYDNLSLKGLSVAKVVEGGKTFIELRSSLGSLSTMGVGFTQEDLEVAAKLGYVISPQIKSWLNPTEESLVYIKQAIEAIPNVGPIYFADQDILGSSSPIIQEMIGEHQLGFVEFFSTKQKGFGKLAKAVSEGGTNFNVVRLHTLTDAEVSEYDTRSILDRFLLAMEERNLRVFLFKMPSSNNIEKDMNDVKAHMEAFSAAVQEKGYSLGGGIDNFNLKAGNYVLSLLAGIASLCIFVLICMKLGFDRFGYIVGIIGVIGYAGLLKLSPNLGLKMMALFGATMFPTYAVLSVLDTKAYSLKNTIFAFLKASIISFGGALTIIGTISRTSFALGIDVFAGVKLAHVIPLALVLIIVIYQEHGFDVNYVKRILTSKVTYLALALMAILAMVLFIYTSRTGNTGEISNVELQMRQILDTVLGVRPRTKEFLIGHPIMIALLYYGYKEKYLPFLIFGMIGQISLVNTYAHIHTPVMVSLIRSGYGIVIGLVIGIILIYVIKLVAKVIKKWDLKTK